MDLSLSPLYSPLPSNVYDSESPAHGSKETPQEESREESREEDGHHLEPGDGPDRRGAQKNKDATYADIKAKADKKGLPVYPIMYGRAKLLLGMVKAGKKTGSKTTKKSAKKKAGKRGPGRPKKTTGSKSERIRELLSSGRSSSQIAEKVGCSVNLVYAVRGRNSAAGRPAGRPKKTARRGPGRPRKTASQVDTFQDLITTMKAQERESTQLRGTLEKIAEVIERTM